MSIQYRVYKGDSSGGPVDYTTAVATTSSLSAALAALSPSTTTRFAVRAYDTVSGLDDGNTDAVVQIAVDGSGRDASGVPYPPEATRVFAGISGSVTVEWSYPHATPLPTGFHVYYGTGGTVSYATVRATTAAPNRSGAYRAALTGLTGGTTYSIGVRAFNAAGEETNTSAVTVTAATAAPPSVAGLAAAAGY